MTPEVAPPSAIEMRRNLAVDAQMNRYSDQVLIAMMRCIDGTADEFNDHCVYPSLQSHG